MGKTQINVQLDESQKERWENAVDERGRFSSLSDLVRASVEAEIKDEHESGGQSSPALESDITDLREDVERIRKDVTWLRDQEQDEVDISDLAQSVFDSLHTLPDVNPAPDADVDRDEYAAVTAIQDYGPQTTEAIADRLDSSPRRVEDAIDHLQDEFLPVTSVTHNGERHYFKED